MLMEKCLGALVKYKTDLCEFYSTIRQVYKEPRDRFFWGFYPTVWHFWGFYSTYDRFSWFYWTIGRISCSFTQLYDRLIGILLNFKTFQGILPNCMTYFWRFYSTYDRFSGFYWTIGRISCSFTQLYDRLIGILLNCKTFLGILPNFKTNFWEFY